MEKRNSQLEHRQPMKQTRGFFLHVRLRCGSLSIATPVSLLANTGPRSAVGNVSSYRCVSDCNSRGCEFDLGPVPYFRGDCS